MKSLMRIIFLVALSLGLPLAAQQEENALEALAEQILQAVSEVRGLEPLRDVPKGVLSRDAIEEAFRKRIAEDYSAADLERERRLLVKLGVLPREYDYIEGAMRVLNEQVAGYYDPRHKTLFIADWLPPEVQQMTMAHELTHALQDQHYELEEILSDSESGADALLARRAVVEGDAVAVMFDYLLRPLQQSFVTLPNLKDLYEQTLTQQLGTLDGTQQLQQAPPFIRDSLLFSYIWGARFMQVYRQSHEWSETDGLYAALPSSTEQIMHPEKYLEDRDDPTTLNHAVDEKLTAWVIDYSETFGEYQSYLTLRQFLPDDQAQEAAAGWDGDQIRLLEDEEGRLAVQWDSTWDSAAEARQFRDSYAVLIQEKYKLKDEPRSDTPGGFTWETEFDRVELRLNGASVRILEIEKVPVRSAY